MYETLHFRFRNIFPVDGLPENFLYHSQIKRQNKSRMPGFLSPLPHTTSWFAQKITLTHSKYDASPTKQVRKGKVFPAHVLKSQR